MRQKVLVIFTAWALLLSTGVKAFQEETGQKQINPQDLGARLVLISSDPETGKRELQQKNVSEVLNNLPVNQDSQAQHTSLFTNKTVSADSNGFSLFRELNIEFDPHFIDSVQYQTSPDSLVNQQFYSDTLQYFDASCGSILTIDFPSQIAKKRVTAFGARFSVKTDAVLNSVQFATWGRVPHNLKMQCAVTKYPDDLENLQDHSFDLSVFSPAVSGNEHGVSWNEFHFCEKPVNLSAGEDIYFVFRVASEDTADTIQSILDTAAVKTDRSFVLIDNIQNLEIAGFKDGNNWLVRPIVNCLLDSTFPDLETDIIHNIDRPGELDIVVTSRSSTTGLKINGWSFYNGETSPLVFKFLADSGVICLNRPLSLPDSALLEININASLPLVAPKYRDTMFISVARMNGESGGLLASATGDLIINIPRQAFRGNCIFTLFPAGKDVEQEPKLPDIVFTSQKFQIGPTGFVLEKFAELTFCYENNAEALLAENRLAVAFFDQDKWVIIDGELYREERLLKALVNRTGLYNLVYKISNNTSLENTIPENIFLQPNYPNPFNPKTTIRFSVPSDGNVSLRIINLRGQIIATLLDNFLTTGEHKIDWDGTDDYNVRVASGVYLYRLTTGEIVETRKLLLVK